MIQRQRKAHERLAGEDHQPEAHRALRADQPAHLGDGRVEAAGPQIGRGHALRNIERDHHAQRRPLQRRLVCAELRARRREREQRQRGGQRERRPTGAPPRVGRRNRAAAQLAQRQQVEPPPPPEQPAQRQGERRRGQPRQQRGRAERNHGILRQGPARAPTSSKIRPNAASSSHGASSRERSNVSSPTRARSNCAISS